MINVKTITLFSLDYLNRKIIDPTYTIFKNNIRNNLETYFIIFSILTLYYLPFLFISGYTIFLLYLVYYNIVIDFEYEIRIDTNSRNHNKNTIIFNNKKDKNTQTVFEKDD